MHLNKLIYLFLFISSSLLGQQVEQYSLGHIYKGLQNPGAIGEAPSLQAVGIVRQQWVALSGAPTSQYLAVEMPIGIFSGGIGASFQQTRIGVHNIQRLIIGYSYHRPISDNGFIGLGLKGGLVNSSYDGRKIRTPEGEYGTTVLDHHDNLLSYSALSGNAYSMDAGLYAELNNFSVGVSVVNALAGKTNLRTLELQNERHLFGNMSYVFEVSQSIQINAGIQTQWNSALFQAQALVLGTWNELYTLGATMRGLGEKSMESIGGIVGYKLNEHFQLFYSYEYNILPLRNVFDANHELAIAYSLNKPIGKGRLPKSIYNPRFF